ncbi:hypothetical protein DBR26_00240 [Pseudomonas sp. HMWF007]|nr:hypothetical protein DBR26_00240 [Pseudomonas sp. HMWF007]PTT94414.1 hypothetical protein DBR29_03810 [Pseudomonas sp. HMWF005]
MATISNYAMVAEGKVINLIVWDGDTESWSPPEDVAVVKLRANQRVDIGDLYDGSSFTAVGDPWAAS